MPEKKVNFHLKEAMMNQLQNKCSERLKNISMTSLKNTAKSNLAKSLKKIRDFEFSKEDKKIQNPKIYEGASQDDIPIKNIKYGIVQTKDGRYIGIVEVLPINYDKKNDVIQARIIKSFSDLFHDGPFKISIEVLSDTSNPNRLINNIKEHCKQRDNPKIQTALDDYINNIIKKSESGSVYKSFFIVYEYNSSDMKTSSNTDESSIISSMYEYKDHIKSIMSSCGNVCIIPETEDATEVTTEILYNYFNRKTCKKEALFDRYEKIDADFKLYNNLTGNSKKILYSDLIAPKGLSFENRNYVFMDGSYYGYLGITSVSWPSAVIWAWTSNVFDYGANVDAKYIFKRLPRELTILALKQMNNMTKQTVNESHQKGKQERLEKASQKFINNTDVYKSLLSGDTLYDCAIILTVRANTARQLGSMIRAIQKDLGKYNIETDSCFLNCEEYFKMTMPLLYITEPFRRLKHNILSSKIGSMYPYTSYQVFDPTGFVLGHKIDNMSMAVINNFNRSYYKNANILLVGTSGAGKTFTEQIIGRRQLLMGQRCFFIIPQKAYEYEKGCVALDGCYVRLRPGSKDCLNIMEIRPEGELNSSLLEDDIVLNQTESLLAKKINDIITWVQLLIGNTLITTEEYNCLNRKLVEVYADFGITNNNHSIYIDNNSFTLKEMPIISNLDNKIKLVPELKRIHGVLETFIVGNCSNMNGQTNINLDNDYIVFDVDENYISENLLPSFLFMAFTHVYNTVKENPISKDLVFLDEVWKMMLTDDSAKQIQKMVKLIRGYGGATVIATQELEDFMNSKNNFGKSVVNNSEITIVLNLKDTGLDLVKKSLKLTEEDCDTISGFKSGSCMLISNGDKINVSIDHTDTEFELFNTNKQMT